MTLELYDQAMRDFDRVFGSRARPIAPQPSATQPQHAVPDDRTDFTRDNEATGV